MSQRWNWLPDLGGSVTLIVAETMWFALTINTALSGRHINVSLLAVIGPALISLGLASAFRVVRMRGWQRAVALTGGYLVLTLLFAGFIGIAIAHVGFATVAFHPWSGAPRGVFAGVVAAWVAVGVTCARGLWLGARPPSFQAATYSIFVSLTAFVTLFITFAVERARDLRGVSSSSLPMFVVFLVLSMTALVATRQLELERGVRDRASVGSRWARIGGVTVAATLIALCAVLVTLAFGPAAASVGHGVGVAVGSIAHGIAWVWEHIPRGQHKVKASGGSGGGRLPGRVSVLVAILLLFVPGLVVLALLLASARRIRRYRRRRDSDEDVDEERDTVFSWRHLWEHLGAIWRELLRRRKHPVVAPIVAASVVVPDRNSVRGQYRYFLDASAQLGVARAAAETSSEFELHIAKAFPLSDGAVVDLRELTLCYESVRYGDSPDADLLSGVTARAQRVVADLVAAVDQRSEGPEDSAT